MSNCWLKVIIRKFVYQQTLTNGLGFVVPVNPVLDRRFLLVAFNMWGPKGTDLLGLDGGVPNGDPGLLFSLLVSFLIVSCASD